MTSPPRPQTQSVDQWDDRYRQGDTPWDSGLVERELIRFVGEPGRVPGPALDLGCGTGTNAVYLAQRGYAVTAVDGSARALDAARQKATAAGVAVEFIEADLLAWPGPERAFPFVFDRGCYHCLRRVDAAAARRLLARAVAPGGTLLILTGSADETVIDGPPRLTAAELVAELEPDFALVELRAVRFIDPGEVEGPRAWSGRFARRG